MIKYANSFYMNTTKKGKDFEDKVFKYLSSLLEKDVLPFANSKFSKIFQHKKYNCIGYDREIEFDITIETYNSLSASEQWSSLVVVECKNYSGIVDISDLDEFEEKLHKISDSSIKGVFVTTKGFSKNEIQQAEKNHIALVVMSENEPNWIVSRDINNKAEDYYQFLSGSKVIGNVPIVYSEGSFTTVIEMLNGYDVVTSNKNVIKIPYLENDIIQQKVCALCQDIVFATDDIPGEIITKAFPEYKITFKDFQQGLLGTLSLENKVITLSNEIVNDTHRLKFTLAHEIGHIILHSEILKNSVDLLAEYEEESLCYEKAIQRMEIQANIFAAYLIVPKWKLNNEVKELFGKYNINKGRLYLDNQLCNIRNYQLIVNELSLKFDVSKEVIKYRLEEENLLTIANGESQRLKYLIKTFCPIFYC